jgi:hypothetical protein
MYRPDSTKQGPFWEINCHSLSLVIPNTLRNPKVPYRVHKTRHWAQSWARWILSRSLPKNPSETSDLCNIQRVIADEELLTLGPVPKVEDHPLSAGTRHVVMTRDPLDMKVKQSRNKIKLLSANI